MDPRRPKNHFAATINQLLAVDTLVRQLMPSLSCPDTVLPTGSRRKQQSQRDAATPCCRSAAAPSIKVDTQNRFFALRYASGQEPESTLSLTWTPFPSHSNSPTIPIRRKKHANVSGNAHAGNKTRRYSAFSDMTEPLPDARPFCADPRPCGRRRIWMDRLAPKEMLVEAGNTKKGA
jgi:hypothetical protein